MAFVRRDDWQARGGLIMQPKTGQDQSEKRPGAGTEPSTALDPKKVTESPRDKNKDPYTLETTRRIGEDKTPDDVDSFARGRLTRGRHGFSRECPPGTNRLCSQGGLHDRVSAGPSGGIASRWHPYGRPDFNRGFPYDYRIATVTVAGLEMPPIVRITG